MESWNSGGQVEPDRLVTAYIPTLAVAAVGVLLFYATIAPAQAREVSFLPEWCIGVVVAIAGARAAVARYPRVYRMAVAGTTIFLIPGIVLAIGISSAEAIYMLHAAAIFVLAGMAWALVIPVVEQCTGQVPERGRILRACPILTWRPPFITTYVAAEQSSFSGEALGALMTVGAIGFAAASWAYAMDKASVPNPLPYALLFFAITMGLASLSKLVQRLRETRSSSVLIASDFLRMWATWTLVVLVACGIVAAILPKQPLTVPVRWAGKTALARLTGKSSVPVTPEAEQPAGYTYLPGAEVPDREGPGAIRVPGEATSLGAKIRGALSPIGQRLREGGLRIPDSVLNILLRVATLFEPQKTGTGYVIEHGAPRPVPVAARQEARRSTPAAPKLTMAQPAAKARQLRRALSDKPLRIVKVVLALALTGAVLWFSTLLVRRYIWRTLAASARWVVRVAGLLLKRLVHPLQARLARVRRKHRISRLIRSGIDPFLDPFEQTARQPIEEITRRAYSSFLAHAWLAGAERKESQTAYDFARYICKSSLFDPKAVWTITNACVHAGFSQSTLSDAQLAQLRAALKSAADSACVRVQQKELPARKLAYRRMLAERELDTADAAKDHLDLAESVA